MVSLMRCVLDKYENGKSAIALGATTHGYEGSCLRREKIGGIWAHHVRFFQSLIITPFKLKVARAPNVTIRGLAEYIQLNLAKIWAKPGKN